MMFQLNFTNYTDNFNFNHSYSGNFNYEYSYNNIDDFVRGIFEGVSEVLLQKINAIIQI